MNFDNNRNFVAVDVETTGLGWNSKNLLIGAAWWNGSRIETDSKNVGVQSLFHNPEPLPAQLYWFNEKTKGKDFVFHNGSYDIPQLTRDGFLSYPNLWGNVIDTLTLARMTGAWGSVSLGSLVKEFDLVEKAKVWGSAKVKKNLTKYDWFSGKDRRNQMLNFVINDIDEARSYVESDAVLTLLLLGELLPLAKENNYSPQFLVDSGDIVTLSAKMRNDGLALNVAWIEEEAKKRKERLYFLMREVLNPHKIMTPGQEKTMVSFLRKNKVNIPVTASGNPSLNEENLNELLGWDNTVDSVILAVIEAKKLEKSLNEWLERGMYLERDSDNVVHPLFKAGGTVSGRFSSDHPSAHTPPRDIKRNYFTVHPNDAVLWSADLAQAEVRLGALYCKSHKMAQMIADGLDIHTETGNLVWGEGFMEKQPPDRFKVYRHIAKQGRFASQYGSGAFTLSNTINKNRPAGSPKITEEEAKDFLQRYYSAFPEFKSTMNRMASVWKGRGHLVLWNGKRIYYTPRYKDYDKSYAAFNQIVQPGVAEIMNATMLTMQRSDLPITIRNQVHDDLTVGIHGYVKEKDVLEISKELITIMETAMPERLSKATTPPIYMVAEEKIIYKEGRNA